MSVRRAFKKQPRQGQPGVIVGQQVSRTGKDKARVGVHWLVRDGLAPMMDSGAIVDAISLEVMRQHYGAIKAGQKADGSGPQPGIQWSTLYTAPNGRRLRSHQEGRPQPFRRGYKTGVFISELQRFRVSVKAIKRTVHGDAGLQSKVRIGWPYNANIRRSAGYRELVKIVRDSGGKISTTDVHDHYRFLRSEHERGVKYIYSTGKVAQAVSAVMDRLIPTMLDGTVGVADLRPMRAYEAAMHTPT